MLLMKGAFHLVIYPFILINMNKQLERLIIYFKSNSFYYSSFLERAKLVENLKIFGRTHLIELEPIWHKLIENNELKKGKKNKY